MRKTRILDRWVSIVKATVALCIAFVPLAVSAQPARAPLARVPLVSDAEAAPVIAQTFAAIRAAGDQPVNMHRVVANAPDAAAAYIGLARTLRRDNHVSRGLRELTILRALQLENGTYEFRQHTPMALGCGVSQAQISALRGWRASPLFSPQQRAVLGWVDGMAQPKGPAPDSVAAMKASFDPHAIVEITLTASFYVMSARTTRALGIAPETAAAAPRPITC